MRKFLAVSSLILLILTFVITSCGQQAPAPAPAPSPAPAPKPEPVKPIQLKLAYHWPPAAFLDKGILAPWVKELEGATGGRIKISSYPSQSLAKMQDTYDSVVSGLADMAVVVTEITPGRFPLSEVNTLPGIFPNAEATAGAHHELLQKYCTDAELKEVKLLWVIGMSGGQLFTTKPVQKLEDMKGMKIRIEGKVEGWTMEALGASGLLISTMEMYSSLERGLIDGVLLVYEGALVYGVQEVTKYRTHCDLICRGFPILMNRDSWNKLPPDIQQIFEERCTPQVSAHNGALMDNQQRNSVKAINEYDEKAGNPGIYILPADEQARWDDVLFTKVVERWIKEKEDQGLPGRAIVDDAISLVQKYSK